MIYYLDPIFPSSSDTKKNFEKCTQLFTALSNFLFVKLLHGQNATDKRVRPGPSKAHLELNFSQFYIVFTLCKMSSIIYDYDVFQQSVYGK